VTGDTKIEPWILLTNDDSVDSPALPPLLAALRFLAPVRTLVPAQEYSWSSKTLSRFARLRLDRAHHLGDGAHTIEGSPADCANVGIHHLTSDKPGLVVSGVNIGENAGLAFLLSSGTVGAAIEASLAGVPAAAFSLKLTPEVYNAWRESRDPARMAPIWERAAAIAQDITRELLSGGLPEGARLISVNIPQQADLATPRVLTQVSETSYGSFFRQEKDGTLVHHYSGQRRTKANPVGDVDVLEGGSVSITPMRLSLDTTPSPEDRSRFERPGSL
jgi:5'-nucleotidase